MSSLYIFARYINFHSIAEFITHNVSFDVFENVQRASEITEACYSWLQAVTSDFSLTL